MKNIRLFALSLVALTTATTVTAQNNRQRTRATANNTYYQRQNHLLDSVISRYIELDAQESRSSYMSGDNPADDLYEGAWGTSGVNANRVDVSEVPDSVVISCKGYVSPVIGSTTSHFGPRGSRNHYGIDIALRTGDPVGAAFDGKVRITRYDRGGYGYYVVIRHPNGLETVYGHLSEIKVFQGQSVVAGQTIGLGGSTGRSTGPHLHFEARFLGNPINPEKLFDFQENKAIADNYFLVKRNSFDWAYGGRSYRSSSSSNHRHSSSRGGRYHKVRKGETLSGIASRYGVSVKELCRLNRLSRRSVLRPGQRLRCS